VYQKDNLFIESVGFTLKTRKNYIVFSVKSSWKGFMEKWFYIDIREKNVIKGDYRMPITSEAWYSTPIVTEKMQGHIDCIRELRDAGLTAAHIVETFSWWRLIPLKRRDLACTYWGLMDPNRESNIGEVTYAEF
jgi:hypothetical protein